MPFPYMEPVIIIPAIPASCMMALLPQGIFTGDDRYQTLFLTYTHPPTKFLSFLSPHSESHRTFT